MEAFRFLTVMTTTPSKELAQNISRQIVTKRLAACCQITPIQSIYSWKNQVEEEEEWIIQMKTISDHIAAIETLILAMHPYEVPEIMAQPIIWMNEEYKQWLLSQT